MMRIMLILTTALFVRCYAFLQPPFFAKKHEPWDLSVRKSFPQKKSLFHQPHYMKSTEIDDVQSYPSLNHFIIIFVFFLLQELHERLIKFVVRFDKLYNKVQKLESDWAEMKKEKINLEREEPIMDKIITTLTEDQIILQLETHKMKVETHKLKVENLSTRMEIIHLRIINLKYDLRVVNRDYFSFQGGMNSRGIFRKVMFLINSQRADEPKKTSVEDAYHYLGSFLQEMTSDSPPDHLNKHEKNLLKLFYECGFRNTNDIENFWIKLGEKIHGSPTGYLGYFDTAVIYVNLLSKEEYKFLKEIAGFYILEISPFFISQNMLDEIDWE